MILWQDSAPEDTANHQFRANHFLLLIILFFFLGLVAGWTIISHTPVGKLVTSYQDVTIRNEVIEVSQRLLALQDSLLARDHQLEIMKTIIRSATDTTFQTVGSGSVAALTRSTTDQITDLRRISTTSIGVEFLPQAELFNMHTRFRMPDFPAPVPVSGFKTSGFNPSNKHFGLDFAAREGEPIRNSIDGVVISSEWTMNYGNVIIIQHAGGYITKYMHVGYPTVRVGDTINRGDILGQVSSSGLLSTGPHLHFEIWRNGIPQNPEQFLME